MKYLKLMELAVKLYAVYETIRSQPAHQPTTCDAIKTRINGRLLKLGPFPAEWLD